MAGLSMALGSIIREMMLGGALASTANINVAHDASYALLTVLTM